MKQFAVLGCGQFGMSVALTLSELGHDVLAVDNHEDTIDSIADKVAHAVLADVTVEGTLKDLGIGNFDVVIIGMSTNLQASIMATIAAKDLGVDLVVAKVKDALHGRILQKVGADKIVIPERDIGIPLAHNLANVNTFDFLELSEDYSIMEINVPKGWVGKSIPELRIRDKHDINVIAIRSGNDLHINPSPENLFQRGDHVIVIGLDRDILKLENSSIDD
ncbi:MAG: TrkA family potassium uptake protein [Tissierellia bacterium]|nr:TrkA family potassium uptake protein [Tissierellia bacterium]